MYPKDTKTPGQTRTAAHCCTRPTPSPCSSSRPAVRATTGQERLLDVMPESLHQRVPLILGSRNEVERIERYHGRARQRHGPSVHIAALQRALDVPARGAALMSAKHPSSAVTGSSGAGTTTVMKSFAYIFRREGIKAQIHRGRLLPSLRPGRHARARAHRRQRRERADQSFGPEANLLDELAATLAEYGATGGGRVRRYIHDAGEAKELGGEAGTFTDWRPIAAGSDLLFYEGLHGGYKDGDTDVAGHVDLLVGVVPIINLEWIQKLHRDQLYAVTVRMRWSTPYCGACPTT